jgi:hypothetical protein
MSEAKDCMYDECDNDVNISQILNEMEVTDEEKIQSFVYGKPNRQRYYKLFEYAVARKFRAVLWEKIPSAEKKMRGLPQPDCGIDCVSPNLNHAIQAKWWRPDSYVPQKEIGTFFLLGALMGATRFTIVTSEGVTLTRTRPPCIKHVVISNKELVRILVAAFRPTAAPLVDVLNGPAIDVLDEPTTAPSTNDIDEPTTARVTDVPDEPLAAPKIIETPFVDDSSELIAVLLEYMLQKESMATEAMHIVAADPPGVHQWVQSKRDPLREMIYRRDPALYIRLAKGLLVAQGGPCCTRKILTADDGPRLIAVFLEYMLQKESAATEVMHIVAADQPGVRQWALPRRDPLRKMIYRRDPALYIRLAKKLLVAQKSLLQ